jgi:hypothetical protein
LAGVQVYLPFEEKKVLDELLKKPTRDKKCICILVASVKKPYERRVNVLRKELYTS